MKLWKMYEELQSLSDKVVEEYFKIPKEIRKRGLRVTASSAIFVPKPFTPFQWAPQSTMEEVVEKIKAVKYAITSKAVIYNYHESIVSYLEAVIARGDRRICDVIIKAFEKGAKFDGWSEYFNFEIWKEAMEECGV